MAKVLGVGGIFFKSKDFQKLAKWYADCLNIPVEEQWWGANLHPEALPPGAYTVWAPFKEKTSYFDPSEKDFMINLIVDDVAEALQQVKQAGGTITGDIESLEYGDFGWFVDPEGNKVELWMPALPADES
jgi:predicted enzyme related to lactoylglutathione lyase